METINDLPGEILLEVSKYLSNKDLSSFSRTNIRIYNLLSEKYFEFPKFKKQRSCVEIQHLPIKILSTSEIRSVLLFPESVKYVIINNRNLIIPPNIIKASLNITFLIKFDIIRPNRVYHFSNYASKNVFLFSGPFSRISPKCIDIFTEHDFQFWHLGLNHIDYWTEKSFHILNKARIKRIISHSHPISLDLLTQFNFSTLNSSNFSDNYVLLNIIPKLKCLEKLILKTNARFLWEDFLKLKYLYISATIKHVSCLYCDTKPYKQLILRKVKFEGKWAIVTSPFTIHFKRKSFWLQKFDHMYACFCKRSCRPPIKRYFHRN